MDAGLTLGPTTSLLCDLGHVSLNLLKVSVPSSTKWSNMVPTSYGLQENKMRGSRPGTENQLAVLDALSTSEAEVFTGADLGGQPSWEHFSKPSGSVVSSLYRMQIHKEAPPGASHPWLVRLCAESQGH